MGTPWHVYDVITGLARTGRVLLAAHQAGHTAAKPGLLAALATLTTLINHRAGSRPGWVAARGPPPRRCHRAPLRRGDRDWLGRELAR